MATTLVKPDLIIGIDFGMTYTGVAWTNLSNPTQVEARWPGQVESAESKVPTKLLYTSGGSVASWGYGCDEESILPGQKPIQWFKIYLDPDNLERARSHGLDTPLSVAEAKVWVTDYLRQIYRHLCGAMQRDGQGWDEKRIDFIFSVPTTWTNQSILNDFNAAVRAAGFGTIPGHTAQCELTEAEAAAVYTLKGRQIGFTRGDIMLVCDAGGGTTDLALFKVAEGGDPPILNQLSQVQGVGIGSTVIDRKFRELVKQRIKDHPDGAALLPPGLPGILANSQKFRAMKHSFGTVAGDHENYYLKLDGVTWNFNHEGLQIEGGRMRFSKAEIKGLFDPVTDGIIRKIEEQLNWMMKFGEAKQVKYLILSGGLGSSEYVRKRLEEKYVQNRHPMGVKLVIFTSAEPQLAVAKGLVEDRRQRLEAGRSVLQCRIARASYGVICMKKYDPKIHVGEDVVPDEWKPKKGWALQQIDWLIKKGDIVETDTARERAFFRTLEPHDPTRRWNSAIVISHNEPEFLPRSMKQGGAHMLCTLESNLSAVEEHEFMEKGKHFWSRKKHHYVANFSIKVIIAPADVKFELWFNGMKYSRDHDPITVEWDKIGIAMKPKDPEVLSITGLKGF